MTSRTVLAWAMLIIACLSAAAWAGPGEDELGDLAGPLGKKIKVQFLDTPLRRVIEQLQRDSGVTMVLQLQEMEGAQDAAVSLESPGMTVKEVLDWSCRVAGADWEIVKGVIAISSAQEVEQRSLTTRIYDIGSLVKSIPHFVSPALDLNSALSNTNSGGSGGRMGADIEKGGGLFGDTETESEFYSRQEAIEHITSLIQDTVGRAEEWASYGGATSSLREIDGYLIVRTTPARHKALESFIADMSRMRSRMVTLEARYLRVKTATLDKALGSPRRLLFDAKSADALVQALTNDADVSALGLASSACYNGQRVYVSAGKETTFLSDLEPIPNTGGSDPTLSTARQGAVLDIEPTIGMDGKSVALVVRSDLVTNLTMRTTAVPVGSAGNGWIIEQSGTLTGRVREDAPAPNAKKDEAKPAKPLDAELEGRVHADGVLHPPRPASFGVAQLEMPDQTMVRYRTAVQIPDGGAVVITGLANTGDGNPGGDEEVVLILRATANAAAK